MAPVAREEDELSEAVPKLLCQMDNHLACVNCVRWSSDGRHLASGGDDRVIMIWQIGRYGGSSSMFGGSKKMVNVEHWKCVSTLRGHSGDVLDLAWSPHDAWLASCSVDNTVVIWNTKRWQEILAVLKGHTGLVKGVSWDPVGKYVASQLTCLKRPLVVVHDLFSNSVLDISWSQGGNQLLVCSWDGTVAYIDFSEEEIGTPITPEERNLWHQKLYGKSLSSLTHQLHNSAGCSTLVEDPEVLKAQEQQQQQLAARATRVAAAAQGPTDKQIETRMPDGRRRITPLFIPPDPEIGDVPVPFNSQALPNFSSSTESKSKIVIEKRDESSSVPAPEASDKSSDKPTTALKETAMTLNAQNQEKESAQQTITTATTTTVTVVASSGGEGLVLPACAPFQAEKGDGARPSSAQAPGHVPHRQQALFPALKQNMPVTVKISPYGDSTMQRSVQLQTDIPVPGSRTVSKVRCSTEESVFWEHLVSGRGVALAGSRLLLTGGEDAVAHCSDHYASMPPLDGMNGSALPLGSLQHNMYRGPRGARSVFHAGPSLQQAGTLSFLDGQVSAALALRSGHEYRFWTLTLVRYLASEGKGTASLSRELNLCPNFKGVNKRDLLREILPVLASNLRLQRLFSEFKEQLDTASLPPNG
ncbi:histone transcription regulator, putative [Ixodes scapularis]|uniref:Histone transcription regulator, putative n=1 Tax=Ixodes scapularis TaxID=6945 RepID=B7PHN8_IXOSC|nr:histone transcription regulator, putative [Ixodes scapularis]|eukprot:XP_002403345.1 histone transcription regulator, putative [Ixodes scapularis]